MNLLYVRCFLIVCIFSSSVSRAEDWRDDIDLPEEAKAVLAYQKWLLPKEKGDELVDARVVHMHAGIVTFQLKRPYAKSRRPNALKSLSFNELKPEYQKLALEWREWKPRKVYHEEFKAVSGHDGELLSGKLIATIGTQYAVYEIESSEFNEDGTLDIAFPKVRNNQTPPYQVGGKHACLRMSMIHWEERLRIFRVFFHGEFEPMKVVGEAGLRYEELGLKPYQWVPGQREDFEYGLKAQLHVPELKSNMDKFPLVVFLHDRSGAGTDNVSQFVEPEILSLLDSKNKRRFPCFLLCPQYPKGVPWHSAGPAKPYDWMKGINHMVKMLRHDYPQIDPARVYVIGSSSSGRASLEFITGWPNVYAAAVAMPTIEFPASFYFEGKDVQPRPFWAIWEGGKVRNAEKTLGEIKGLYEKLDMPLKTTVYEKGETDFWSQAYTHDGFMQWLFSQHLGEKPNRLPVFILSLALCLVALLVFFKYRRHRKKTVSCGDLE